MNFNTSLATIVDFPAWCGGKFITNCLGLSSQCLLNHGKHVDYLLENPNDIEYRLQAVLKTLPGQGQTLDWRGLEVGDIQTYGQEFLSWTNLGEVNEKERTSLLSRICDSGLRFFITSHNSLDKIINVWPLARVIRLVKHQEFQDLSMSLKSDQLGCSRSHHNGNYCQEKYEELSGTDWPTWQQFESIGYDVRLIDLPSTVSQEISMFYPTKHPIDACQLIEIDTLIWNRELFLSRMAELYTWLNLRDFNSVVVGDYYDTYIKLHRNTNNA